MNMLSVSFIIAVLLFLVWDGFSGMMVNGGSFLNALKFKWYHRWCNLRFSSYLKKYTKNFETQGTKTLISKHVFAYLDYDEYVQCQVFEKDRVSVMTASLTDGHVTFDTYLLTNLPEKDAYFGSNMLALVESYAQASVSCADLPQLVDQMIQNYPSLEACRESLLAHINNKTT